MLSYSLDESIVSIKRSLGEYLELNFVVIHYDVKTFGVNIGGRLFFVYVEGEGLTIGFYRSSDVPLLLGTLLIPLGRSVTFFILLFSDDFITASRETS